MTHETRVLAKLRALCLALPNAVETVSFGHPTFRAARKTFAVLEVYKGELCIVFKAELPVQQALVKSPRFFVAPYVGKHGWVSLRAGGELDWGEVRDLVTESHRLVAPPARDARARAGSKRRTPPARPARKKSRRAP